MKIRIIRYVTILLAFLAGFGFMNYMTYMGNRDMTAVMAEATLPVAYVEQDGQFYNEMHGYVDEMDGSYMKDTIIGLSQDHQIELAVEKYNAKIESFSYEVRSLDMSRLIESGQDLEGEDDGTYVRYTLTLKDLLEQGEKYLLILQVATGEQEKVSYYSLLSYLGENHVQDCVDFAEEFHRMTVEKETGHTYLQYLEPNGTMDGKSLGYVNIHSRSGPITWGDMQIEQITDTRLHFTEFDQDVTSLVMDYQVQNIETKETYQVSESFRIRYTSSRMYLLAYERTADSIFTAGSQIVEDGAIAFGIQSEEPNYLKNDEENVVAFVRQGQLWSYDFGQNRLSLVYGFEDGDDARGFYQAHDFRLLDVDDSGSMDFLVYGYMNRGRYEGMSGVLLCHYDALMSTVEEQFFLQGDRPYEALKEEIGALAVENEEGMAWLSYRGMILQIDLDDCSVKVLAEGIRSEWLKVSDSGSQAAWIDENAKTIRLLDAKTGTVRKIEAGDGEQLKALGFMEEDFIYGAAREEDIRTDAAGQQTFPMQRIVIRDNEGQEVREFDYLSKGKYVTGVTIVENRIDLSCISKSEDGSYVEALPEPITYTSEVASETLKLTVTNDEIKRNEYSLTYGGTLKSGSMKRPRVKLVLFEKSRTIQMQQEGQERYLAYSFGGHVVGFDTLSEAIDQAYDQMGSVWKNGSQCIWQRGGRQTRRQLYEIDDLELPDAEAGSIANCLTLLLRQKQIYTDVQADLDAGMVVWEILDQELGEESGLLPGCSLSCALYYVSSGMPVVALTETGDAVLIVGYDTQNIIYYEPGKTSLTKAGIKEGTTAFERGGNLFFTCLP
jgi:hypothetical protein